jgi:hypothetical protein
MMQNWTYFLQLTDHFPFWRQLRDWRKFSVYNDLHCFSQFPAFGTKIASIL